jgi:predicted RNA-binding Zn-ribbon protein involved in translation (DUF1610 family)
MTEWRCPECGQPRADDGTACPSCGAETVERAVIRATKRCATCGEPASAAEDHCPECGFGTFEPLDTGPAARDIDSSYREWRCESCGKGHVRNTPPCDRCGHITLEPVKVEDEDVEVDALLPENEGLGISLELVALVAIVLGVVVAAGLGLIPLGSGAPVDTGELETALVDRIGEERTDRGLESLSRDEALAGAATEHNRARIDGESGGRDAIDGRLADAGVGCDTHHAALFETTIEDGDPARLADGIVTAWVDSSVDRAAVLSENTTRFGIDARFGDGDRLYVTAIAC